MRAGIALLFLQLLAMSSINISFCNGSSYVGCIEKERQALLRFKKDLTYQPSNRLAAWIADGDCCKWIGVRCDSFTGHVLELRLRNPSKDDGSDAEFEAYERSKLGGKINLSLLDLKHLIYLDLSYNDFEGIHIPRFLGSMENLRYLNLSRAGFVGMIPHQLGNLSNLQYLDVRPSYLSGLYVEDFGWLSHLSLLEHLDLSGVDLSRTSDGPLMTNALRSLKVLRLSGCQLHHFSPLSFANFTSLVTLNLSDNQFDDSLILSRVFGLSNLVFLDLSTNYFRGAIPDPFENSTSLKHLDLSGNYFSSSIPDWLDKFSGLEYLSLSNNKLEGSISSALGNLTSVKILDLSSNKLKGKIPTSFRRLCSSRSISLSYNQMSQYISEVFDIFSGCISNVLESLDLSGNRLFGRLTNQLGEFKSLDSLDLSLNSVSGQIPSSLGQLSSLRYLDISNNNLKGSLSQIHFANLTRLLGFDASGNSLMLKVSPDWVPPFQLKALVLRSCHLGPQFPLWLRSQKNLIYLELCNSGISDTIPSSFLKSLFQINYLNLSHNQIYGEIPNLTEATQLETLDLCSNKLSGPLPIIPSGVTVLDLSNNTLSGSVFPFLCHEMNKSKRMQVLKLSRNLLSGEIPDCWMRWQYLLSMDLGQNNFSGNLPNSLGALSSLQILDLHQNSLSGTMPGSLQNCRELRLLNIRGNEFIGNIPPWLGERLSRMTYLILRSNKFYGFFPLELCQLGALQILDLSNNNLTGEIPRCISNLTAMVTMDISSKEKLFEDALIVYRRKVVKYPSIAGLIYMRGIDLSSNNFTGEIPVELTYLRGLQFLNLSINFFSGRIPENIGAMVTLESLDISTNRLRGEIPQTIVNLHNLSFVNLSHNTLTGKVPDEGQFLTFDDSSYMGNDDLCGRVLGKECAMNVSIPEPEYEEGGKHRNEDGVDLFFVSMELGFIWWIFGV